MNMHDKTGSAETLSKYFQSKKQRIVPSFFGQDQTFKKILWATLLNLTVHVSNIFQTRAEVNPIPVSRRFRKHIVQTLKKYFQD